MRTQRWSAVSRPSCIIRSASSINLQERGKISFVYIKLLVALKWGRILLEYLPWYAFSGIHCGGLEQLDDTETLPLTHDSSGRTRR